MRLALLRAVEQTDEPVDQVGLLKLLREIAGNFPLRLAYKRGLSSEGRFEF